MSVTRGGAALAGAVWLALAGAAVGSEQTESSSPEAPKEVVLDGVRIAIDPKTGDLRPLTPAEAKKLQDAMQKRFPAREVELTQRPDGALSSVVAPNLLTFSVARKAEGGRVERDCVSTVPEALAVLKSASRRPAGPEEK